MSLLPWKYSIFTVEAQGMQPLDIVGGLQKAIVIEV